MAVVRRATSTTLVLSVESGIAPDGSAIYATRSIPKVDPALTDEKAYDFASAVGTLQSCLSATSSGRTNARFPARNGRKED